MSGINNIQAEGQIYDILAPEIVNDYVEKLGKTCINPNGYTKGSLILATDGSNVQRLYKTTSNISSNQVISEGGNVELKKLEDLFDDLEDALNDEIDDIDTELGNVKQALADEVEVRAKLGAHNLIDTNTLLPGDPNGANIYIRISTRGSRNIYLASGESVDVKVTNTSSDVQFCLYFFDAATYTYVSGTSWLKNTTYTATQDCYVEVSFRHSNDASINASDVATAKVLARYSKDAYTGFTPFAPMNSQLLSYKDNDVLGAKNLLKNTASTAVEAGVNCNVTSDGRVVCTRVSSSSSDCLFVVALHTSYTLPKGSYHLSGCPTNVSGNPYSIQLFKYVSGNLTSVGDDMGSGLDFTLSEDSGLLVRIRVSSSYDAQNLEFKPMIRLATDTDPTYQPFAMTNQQLTDKVVVEEASGTLVSGKLEEVTKYRQGNVVFISGKITSNAASGDIIMTDVPRPANDSGIAVVPCDYTSGLPFTGAVWIGANRNDLKIFYTGSFSSGAKFFSMTYICKD